MPKELPIDPRLPGQIAKGTIKNIVDAIIELVTNSDDSYRRLEEKGNKVSGEIQIHVSRKKGSICERLSVKDFAEGMTRDKLEKALVFAGVTSGFEAGKSVRGLFGRGLKEAILPLGEGEIKTIKDGQLYNTKLWEDNKTKKSLYANELLNTVENTSEENGTTIDIRVTNEEMKLPEFKTLNEQISKHYALRDINSSEHRAVRLIFDDLRRRSKTTAEVKFTYPEGRKVFEEEISLPSSKDRVKLVIYESPRELDYKRYDPCGLAGILIKTKSAILDNKLFKFENDPAALYFFGEAICYGLEERLRKGETELIDFNRAGLEWRHEYCQELATTIQEILEPLVLEKRKALEKKPEKEVKESTKKILRKLCNLLNELAKKELEDIEGPPVGPEELVITNLVIIPEAANIHKDKPRVFSIYAPTEIIKDEGNEAHIKSDNPVDIQPLATTVKLEKHPKYPDKIWYRYFKVVGRADNAEGTLTVILGRETASAKVKVAPPKERKKGELTGRKGGFISDIKPDEEESPYQRTRYEKDTGIIKIFVKFPSVAKFIKGAFEEVDTGEGRILLAELVGEAFCRELARRKLDTNPPVPGSEIDAFNDEVNKIQKTTLHQIQEIIFAWKFKE